MLAITAKLIMLTPARVCGNCLRLDDTRGRLWPTQRGEAGAAFVWNDGQAQVGDPREIQPQVFVLKGRTVRAKGVSPLQSVTGGAVVSLPAGYRVTCYNIISITHPSQRNCARACDCECFRKRRVSIVLSCWLAGLPLEAWVYDLRAPGAKRGLPYGLARERGELYRCGRLPCSHSPARQDPRRVSWTGELLWVRRRARSRAARFRHGHADWIPACANHRTLSIRRCALRSFPLCPHARP
jgi:hypothetical protein